MNPYLEIIRPGNVLMASIAVLLVAIIGHNYNLPIFLAMISVFFVISGGNVINDYFDYKIDLINRPDRPIPSGRITLEKGKTYAYFLFLCGIITGLLISYIETNLIPSIIVIFPVVLLYLYAYKLKSTILIGNLIVGFLTCLCFIFGGYVIGIETKTTYIINISYYLGLFAFIMTSAREITKDMEDIKGDLLENVKTFPIVYGTKISSILVSILIIIDSSLSPILYFFKIFNIIYLIIVLIAVALFLYGSFLILKNQNEKTCNKVSKLLKIGMLISFIGFAIGSF